MSFLLNIYIDLKELIYLLFYLGNTDWMSFRFLDFFEVHMIWGGFALYRHMLDRFTLYRCVRFKLYFIYLAVHWGRVFTVILHSHNTQIYVVQMRPIYIVLYLSCCTLGQSVYSHITQSQYTNLRCTDASDLHCTLFILLYIGAECLQSYCTVTIHRFTLYRWIIDHKT